MCLLYIYIHLYRKKIRKSRKLGAQGIIILMLWRLKAKTARRKKHIIIKMKMMVFSELWKAIMPYLHHLMSYCK